MNEPSLLLRLAMFHFPSGDGYLGGLLLFCVAQAGLHFIRQERWHRVLTIVARVGLIWSIAVPSPVPLWLIVLFIASLTWLWNEVRRERAAGNLLTRTRSATRVAWGRGLVLALTCIAVLWELPYRFNPRVTAASSRLCIVGDSITAGLNDGEDTWPQRLARSSPWQIVDASQPGATLKSALQQVTRFDDEPSLLLLEIGGNDLLEGLPVAQFDRDLEQLLVASRRTNRTVLMFELPLPPLAFRYGATQRRLAFKYEVALLPKRLLMSVLTTLGATVDGIHLSPNGHELMAQLVAKKLNSNSLKQGEAGSYRHVGP